MNDRIFHYAALVAALQSWSLPLSSSRSVTEIAASLDAVLPWEGCLSDVQHVITSRANARVSHYLSKL